MLAIMIISLPNHRILFLFFFRTISAESWLGVNTDSCRIFMDGANPSLIGALKDRVDEDGHVGDDVIVLVHIP